MTLLFIVFVVVLLLGFDLVYAMGLAGLAWLVQTHFGVRPMPYTLIPQQLMSGVDAFTLLALPMFLLAGEIMSRGSLTARLVQFSVSLVGHIKGGLAQVSIVVNMIMSGMSGSALADLAASGSLLIPSMVKRGYSPAFAAAVISAGATMGPIIPPSIPLVLIGSLVSVSVGKLFLGGIIPGVLMGLVMMIVVFRYAKRHDLPVEPRPTLRQVVFSFWASLPALLMPVIVLGPMLTGLATPTEASVIAVVYALVLSVGIYREIRIAELPGIFADVSVTSAAVMVIVAAAQLFGWITTAEGLGNLVGAWLLNLTHNPYVMLLAINVLLLLLGMILEPVPIILIMVPILFPIVTPLGIDPVHFGIVLALNLMIGSIHPPVGLNILMASLMAKVNVWDVVRHSWGFLFVLIALLLVLTYFPSIVLFLPNLYHG